MKEHTRRLEVWGKAYYERSKTGQVKFAAFLEFMAEKDVDMPIDAEYNLTLDLDLEAEFERNYNAELFMRSRQCAKEASRVALEGAKSAVQAEGLAFIAAMPKATNTTAVVRRVRDSAEKRQRMVKEAQAVVDKRSREQKRARDERARKKAAAKEAMTPKRFRRSSRTEQTAHARTGGVPPPSSCYAAPRWAKK